jgi:K+-transporting ATPase KdpF subunit
MIREALMYVVLTDARRVVCPLRRPSARTRVGRGSVMGARSSQILYTGARFLHNPLTPTRPRWRHGHRLRSDRGGHVRGAFRSDLRDRADMTHVVAPLAAFVAHMSFADFFGLVVSVLVIIYLLYALLRGERF